MQELSEEPEEMRLLYVYIRSRHVLLCAPERLVPLQAFRAEASGKSSAGALMSACPTGRACEREADDEEEVTRGQSEKRKTMRLYVLGPAFQLPSIDAECIAAVALAKRRVKAGEWSIVPTHDQTRRLPYLEVGGKCHLGFGSIVRYLDEDHSQSAPALSEEQRANSTAITSFITTHAQTLLDISLYVSADNYACTRTAFTKILPWHANYTLPPSRRKAARLRTDHLGISSIDVDDVHDDLSGRPPSLAQDVGKEAKDFEPEIQKRASLLLGGRETVRSLLRRPEHSAVFKLHALAENFFGPLQDMLGEEKFLLGTEGPTAVDCLAYGYLSLMQYPDLPQDWLAKVLARKYGKLLEYLERLHLELDVATNAEDVMALGKCTSKEEVEASRRVCGLSLPWEPPPQSSALDIGRTISTDLISRIPMLYSPTTIVPATLQPTPQWRRYLPLALTLTASSLGLSLYYAFSTGLLIWPHGEEVHIFGKKRFSDYGHLGAALAGVTLLGRQAQGDREFHQREETDSLGDVEVEVDVEKEGR